MKHRHTLLVSLGAWMTIMGVSLVSFEEYWGFFGHRRINRLTVFTLVPEMMPVFKNHIEYLTEHAVDPDKRRYAVPGEAIRHYIDLDVWRQMGADPLPKSHASARALLGDWVLNDADGRYESIFEYPRLKLIENKKYIRIKQIDTHEIDFYEYQRFVSGYIQNVKDPDEAIFLYSDTLNTYFKHDLLPGGQRLLWIDTFSKHGILPYTIPQVYNRLVYAFKTKDLGSMLRLSADLGHYIGDAHVPLHTTSNYNGQKTGQTGLHAFWESRIPELFADQSYDYLVGKANYIKDIEDFSWKIVYDSHRFVDSVLSIEKRLSLQIPASQQYCFTDRNLLIVKLQCEAYARAYQTAMKGMVEARMRAAILAVGSAWYSAWIDAGQPDLSSLNEPRVGIPDSLHLIKNNAGSPVRPEH